jgi:hypothetical protein
MVTTEQAEKDEILKGEEVEKREKRAKRVSEKSEE